MAQTARVERKVWVPEVPEKRIRELAQRIKPVVRFAWGAGGIFRSSKGYPYHIENVDLFKIAYTWDPKPIGRATGLRPVCDIRTYHAYGYYGLFKPSIAEVLAQIPTEHVHTVVAFEIVNIPQTKSDLHQELDALNAGYQVATTRLYTR